MGLSGYQLNWCFSDVTAERILDLLVLFPFILSYDLYGFL